MVPPSVPHGFGGLQSYPSPQQLPARQQQPPYQSNAHQPASTQATQQNMQYDGPTPLRSTNPDALPSGHPSVSAGMAPRQPGQQPHPSGSMQPILVPLSLDAFQTMHVQWLSKQGTPPPDKGLLSFDSREIDLYQLHVEVLKAGTITRVGIFDFYTMSS